ncbi:hypothetical protein B0H13DRAFT_2301691 [Mycena leptocephala]|nr:hypothetical protein B0H13DRAFT_2301691 [Mycena leptocephala]
MIAPPTTETNGHGIELLELPQSSPGSLPPRRTGEADAAANQGAQKRTVRVKFIVASALLSAAVLIISCVTATFLVLSDVNDRIPFTGPTPAQGISMIAEFLAIDSDARTLTMDWYPVAFNCSLPEVVVNIFVDPNLLDGSTDDSSASTDPSSSPVFQLNSTEGCHPTLQDSFATFQTVLKLTGRSSDSSSKSRSLQAYPFDKYFAKISMFATLASTNASFPIFIERSFGIPINFDVQVDAAQSSSSEEGFLLSFNISRSGAVRALVLVISIANWLVTIAFVFITVAPFFFDTEIVAEMFVLPIAALFSFTSVRSNLPGAPVGFGTTADYYGILPCLAWITVFTAILLGTVLYQRGAPKKDSSTPTRDLGKAVSDLATAIALLRADLENHLTQGELTSEPEQPVNAPKTGSTSSEASTAQPAPPSETSVRQFLPPSLPPSSTRMLIVTSTRAHSRSRPPPAATRPTARTSTARAHRAPAGNMTSSPNSRTARHCLDPQSGCARSAPPSSMVRISTCALCRRPHTLASGGCTRSRAGAAVTPPPPVHTLHLHLRLRLLLPAYDAARHLTSA